MAVKECTIRVKGMDQPWSTVGAGLAQGIWPQNVVLNADRWGSKTASFELRRKVGVSWPDIRALAPVEISVGGKLVWSGRILEGPEREGEEDVISVQCEGWQHHLDDDVSERYFIHRGPSRWKDMREWYTTALGPGNNVAAGNVTIDQGITLMLAGSTTYSQYDKATAVLDVGEGQQAHRVICDVYTSDNYNGTPRCDFLISTSDDARGPGYGSWTTQYGPYTLFALGADATHLDVTLPTKHRYVFLHIEWGVAGTSSTDDAWAKVRDIAVYARDTDCHATLGTSILETGTVITNVAADTTSLLSSDYSKVETPSFVIGDWAPTEPRTGRELCEALNAFEDRKLQVDTDKRLVFAAKETAPKLEVGSWSPMVFEDASANSSADVYSRVILRGVDTEGRPLSVTRTQSQQPDTVLVPATSPLVANPGFETNTTYYTAYGSSISRQNSVVLSGSWSGAWDDGAGGDPPHNSVLIYGFSGASWSSGTFLGGVTYAISIKIRGVPTAVDMQFGGGVAPGTYGTTSFITTYPTASTHTVSWTPPVDVAGNTVFVALGLTSTYPESLVLDDLTLYSAAPTIIERSNFQRTKVINVDFAGTPDSYTRIGDLWLQNHRKVPFRGSATVVGSSAVRDIKSGTAVAPETLLLHTDDLLRFSHRVDPDTGDVGRDGRIADVTYNLDSDSAQVNIDSSRSNFEAFMSRVGSVLSAKGL